MKNVKRAAFTSIFLLLAAPASCAEKPTSESFSVAGNIIKFSTPEGFCVPEGAYIDFASKMRANDVYHNVYVTLYKCADMKSGISPTESFSLVTLKNDEILLSGNRASYLQEYAKFIADKNQKKASEALSAPLIRQAEKDASEQNGATTTIHKNNSSQQFDQYGYYNVISNTVNVGDKAASVVTGGSITVVNHVIVNIRHTVVFAEFDENTESKFDFLKYQTKNLDEMNPQ